MFLGRTILQLISSCRLRTEEKLICSQHSTPATTWWRVSFHKNIKDSNSFNFLPNHAPVLKRFPLFNNSTGDSYIARAGAGSTFHCYLETGGRVSPWALTQEQQLLHYIVTLPGGGKRKPSFKMVSNMVIQLLHTIKFSMEVPFSNMTQQPVEMQKTLSTKNKVISSIPFIKKCHNIKWKHNLKQLNGDVGPVSIFYSKKFSKTHFSQWKIPLLCWDQFLTVPCCCSWS